MPSRPALCSVPVLLGLISAPALAKAPDFARDVRPILSENCFQCHGPDEENRQADLRLDLKEHALADRDGTTIIHPGSLDGSELWARISTGDEFLVMPPPGSHKSLSGEEKELIRAWIESGAEWSEHWAFVPPKKADVPEGEDPIDYFVRRRLEERGLEPSPRADATTLARRLHLDLLGLPPKPQRVRAFEKAYAERPEEAYRELVDELLASPHFGERMASMWLDAARYGDTSVMHADGPRTMWPWRDWVVDAYNENKPFDEFSIEQLAGDLLPEATVDQKIASGFNRNHPTSDEGGAIPEELRVSYVVDRVQTTANVWMGLTMECAQCHDHKYDPISQREYYAFYAFFNNHTDPGMQTRKGNQAPVVRVPDPAYDARLAEAKGRIEEKKQALQQRRENAREALANWLAAQPAVAPFATVDAELELAHWFPLTEEKGDELADHAAALTAIKTLGSRERIDGPGDCKALKLNGGTEFSLGRPVQLAHDQPFTFSGWIRLEGNASGAVFSSMNVGNAHRGYDFWVQGGSVGAHIVHSWPENAIKVVSKDKLEPKRWHHIVVAYDGSQKAEAVTVWIDGKRSELNVENDTLSKTIETDAPFTIGARSDGSSRFKGAVADLRIYRTALGEDQLTLAKSDPITHILAQPAAHRSEAAESLLYNHYLAAHDEQYRELTDELAAAEENAKRIADNPTTSMIMGDNPPDKMRPTYILNRGAYDQPIKAEVIEPAVPAIFPALDEDQPAERLGLARWLFRDDHPLTSRVAVNNIWQIFFGAGLVRTPGDFGAQGSFPTHPELLDWVAVDFRENGWNVKRLIRQIVLSETYRRSSSVPEAVRAADPSNRWLARASRFRLQAEFVRDSALAASGLLRDDLIGGPGVKPYQPAGLWAEVGLGGNPKFTQDHGDKLYRRSLYTYWKRSAPPPSMLLFDAPTRETCTMQRPRTNTPLQALVVMNDTQFVEASRFLAERMMKEAGDDPQAIARRGFEIVTVRRPNPRELSALLDVYRKSLQSYEQNSEAAQKLLAVGEAKADPNLDPARHAAWTVVANLLLNLDETLTRE